MLSSGREYLTNRKTVFQLITALCLYDVIVFLDCRLFHRNGWSVAENEMGRAPLASTPQVPDLMPLPENQAGEE